MVKPTLYEQLKDAEKEGFPIGACVDIVKFMIAILNELEAEPEGFQWTISDLLNASDE